MNSFCFFFFDRYTAYGQKENAENTYISYALSLWKIIEKGIRCDQFQSIPDRDYV